jgi:hypothetical protein
MLLDSSLLSVIPSRVLDQTIDCAPLFVVMVVGLGLCVLGLVFALGVRDTWEAERQGKTPAEPPTRWPDWLDAA